MKSIKKTLQGTADPRPRILGSGFSTELKINLSTLLRSGSFEALRFAPFDRAQSHDRINIAFGDLKHPLELKSQDQVR